MKLEKIEINNFKSIASSKMKIENSLTAIVGGNEHGKTNILNAIKILDFITLIKEGDKRIVRKSISKDIGDTNLIYSIKLNPKELSYLKSFFINKEKQQSGDKPSIKETKNTFEKNERISTIPEIIKIKISYSEKNKNDFKVLNIKDLEISQFVIEFIRSSMMNNVFYFDTFEEFIKHRISKEEIINKTDNITNGLIKLAGLKGKEELIFEDNPKARQILNDSSHRLTESIKDFWIQGAEDEIEMVLNISNDGNYLTIDIGDPNTYGAVSTRSRGFLFFISFILKFKECNDGDFKDLIILIDEPGLFLHPKGQKNLLSFLESLAKYNQVIYTTHSPYMINRQKGNIVRIATKDKEKGTIIQERPHGNIDEAFFGGDEPD